MSDAVTAPTPLDLAGRHVVLGLSGGIACYKSAELVRELTKAGATVQVVMTEAAEHFITAVTMQALSNRPVVTSQWDAREPNNMAHINLTRAADAVLVAPASADLMAKLAQGRADDLLSLMCLARPIERCPLLVAPAMNREMWAHPATQRNAAQLRADGAIVLGPASGDQACGEIGDGRMLEPEELLAELVAFFQPKVLQGRTRADHRRPDLRADRSGARPDQPVERQDGLRDRACRRRGRRDGDAGRRSGGSGDAARRAPHRRRQRPRDARRGDAGSAAPRRLHRDRRGRRLAARPRCADQKIKKARGKAVPSFELTENPDILASVAALDEKGGAKRPFCVGFAAESHDLIRHAREKLERKRVPMIVANLGPATFGRDDNRLTHRRRAPASRSCRAPTS